MPTTELTPEMVKQFIEDVENLKSTFETLRPFAHSYESCITYCCCPSETQKEDRILFKRIDKTLKILKHVYPKKID